MPLLAFFVRFAVLSFWLIPAFFIIGSWNAFDVHPTKPDIVVKVLHE